MPSFVTHLSCSRCEQLHDHRVPQNLCSCGSPLLVEYDLEGVARSIRKEAVAPRPPTMWLYLELLPVDDPTAVVSLGEGLTPLVPISDLGSRLGLPHMWVKDDGLNPTGTFKARGAACGVTRCRELEIRSVALPTAGNAGGAWACYGAAAGMKVLVAMPSDAPVANRSECLLHGAGLALVNGLIDDAGRVVAERVRKEGWFDVSTLKEPYRVEGKKTLGFELAEQFGWEPPDVVVYPAGGGIGLIGIWRAFQQLGEIGWLQRDMPRLVVTQAEGCAPLVRAFEGGREASDAWANPQTLAPGLRVPNPLGDFLVLRAVRETGGTAVGVSDEEILWAMAELGRVGVAACPEGAATLAAATRLRERGDIAPADRVVLINTGTAMKYPDALRRAAGLDRGRYPPG